MSCCSWGCASRRRFPFSLQEVQGDGVVRFSLTGISLASVGALDGDSCSQALSPSLPYMQSEPTVKPLILGRMRGQSTTLIRNSAVEQNYSSKSVDHC
jgi:hypothetical protein